jgi:hypothetical protein
VQDDRKCVTPDVGLVGASDLGASTSRPEDLAYLAGYAATLGRLVANQSSLELLLRAVLDARLTAAEQRLPAGVPLAKLEVGMSLPENWLTSWHSLGELIGEYNRQYSQSPIPMDIRDVRNAFAHGRILAEVADGELRLLRFSKPRKGRVTVEENQVLSIDWLKDQVRKVATAMRTLHELHTAQVGQSPE